MDLFLEIRMYVENQVKEAAVMQTGGIPRKRARNTNT
jgi:hypothetical protein